MPGPETINLILKKIEFEAYPEQIEILNDSHRIIQIKGGWRASKSTLAALYLISRYWLGKRFAIIGADYELCRPEFGYLVNWAYKLGIVKECHYPSRDQCSLTLSRTDGASPVIIETKSAKYPERIAGVAYDGIVLAEAAQLSRDIFDIAQGRLVETGGWMMMEGTLEVMGDWFVDKAREYEIPDNLDAGVSYSLPSWVNKAIFPDGENDPKLLQIKSSLGEELYRMRCGGEITVPKDLVLPEFKASLHTGHYPYVKGEPVYIGVDPGYYPSAYAVEFIQYINDEVNIFDEIYEQHFITDQILKLVEDKPFYPAIVGGAIDIAAKQHQGQAPVYKLWKDKTGLTLDTKRILIQDGVERIRGFFIPNPIHGNVRIHINNTCRGLISELGGCKSPFADEGRGSWRIKPDGKPHENNCDAAKAVIYEVVRRFGLAPRRRGPAVSYMR